MGNDAASFLSDEVNRLAESNEALVKACKGLQKACDELLTEFVSKKRAADWALINDALVQAGLAIKSASAES